MKQQTIKIENKKEIKVLRFIKGKFPDMVEQYREEKKLSLKNKKKTSIIYFRINNFIYYLNNYYKSDDKNYCIFCFEKNRKSNKIKK